ncbi:MAG: NUDIX hydrolase [Cytophagaceae bacterium]
MKIKQEIKVTVDAVVFGYNRDGGVSVLLIKRKIEPFIHQWALPGGFVKTLESLEDAVYRELQEETGVKINYLEQLYTFGDPIRDPRARVISVVYFGLVKPENFQLTASTDAEDVSWFNIKKLPKLAFDHKKILQTAMDRLRGKMTYEPIGFELLPNKFPFSDLEQLYMIILDREIDRRNFKKKIMSLGIVDELNEKAPMNSPGRPGNLYRFNKEKYFQLKKQGISFELNS